MDPTRLALLVSSLPLLASCSALMTNPRVEPQDVSAQQTPPLEQATPQSTPPANPQTTPQTTPAPALDPGPRRSLQLAFSDDSAWLTYTKALKHPGTFTLSGFGNDDDDFVLSARVTRYGSPRSASPWTLGLGLGIEAWFVDQPSSQVYAIVAVGHAAYDFDTSFPTRALFDIAFAPEATTSHDGERLIDVLTSLEVEVSAFATAFVGYRLMEITLNTGMDQKLEDSMLAGIRLGF